jgi:hypothetical protein
MDNRVMMLSYQRLRRLSDKVFGCPSAGGAGGCQKIVAAEPDEPTFVRFEMDFVPGSERGRSEKKREKKPVMASGAVTTMGAEPYCFPWDCA